MKLIQCIILIFQNSIFSILKVIMSFIEFKMNKLFHSHSELKSPEQQKVDDSIITPENLQSNVDSFVDIQSSYMIFRESVNYIDELFDLTNVELNTCVFCRENNSYYIYMGGNPNLSSSWIIFSNGFYEKTKPKNPVEVESKPKVEQLERYGYIEI